MKEFFAEYWQWIIGVVAVPILVAVIKVVFTKSGRKQKIGDINGDGNHVINGDIKKQTELVASAHGADALAAARCAWGAGGSNGRRPFVPEEGGCPKNAESRVFQYICINNNSHT